MKKNIEADDYSLLLDRVMAAEGNKALAIVIIAYTGCRPNEALKLTDRSIDIIDGKVTLHLKASKRSSNRSINLPSHLLARFQVLRGELKTSGKQLAAHIGGCSQSVMNSYSAIKRYFITLQWEIFGEQRYTLKSWRHALATRAIKSGIDLVEIQTMLGHKNIASTMSYLADYKKGITLDRVYNLVEGTA